MFKSGADPSHFTTCAARYPGTCKMTRFRASRRCLSLGVAFSTVRHGALATDWYKLGPKT
eukprot:434370-Prorocentrum_minimum.AAC.2